VIKTDASLSAPHIYSGRQMSITCYWTPLCFTFRLYCHVILLVLSAGGCVVLWTRKSQEVYLWDIRSCSPLKVNQRFGGICLLHFQVANRALLAACLCWFLASLNLRLWRWRSYIPPKRRLIFTGLYGVISQMIEDLRFSRSQHNTAHSWRD
jgi:hypothetical protein